MQLAVCCDLRAVYLSMHSSFVTTSRESIQHKGSRGKSTGSQLDRTGSEGCLEKLTLHLFFAEGT